MQSPHDMPSQADWPRLTSLVSSAGCASKIPPAALRSVLATLPVSQHRDLLVGLDTSDDAGVIRLTDTLALIQTVDFFTPIVDNPFDFGRIAAANALSDVYAMGGVPLTALNIVAFPIDDLPAAMLAEILRGGMHILKEADVHLAGGHSVKDAEPKYGLAVTGTVHPDRITANSGAQDGDILILTKAIGTGVLTTAAKRNAIDADSLRPAVDSMTTLNAAAATAMRQVGIGVHYSVHAATDITGFGLLGHLSHMARASHVKIHIQSEAVPLLPKAYEMAQAGYITQGGRANAAFVHDFVHFEAAVSDTLWTLLLDPQTSGGLCIAVRPDSVDNLLSALERQGVFLRAIIGHIEREADSAGIVVH